MKLIETKIPNIFGVKVPSEIELFHIGVLDNQILGHKKDYVFWESNIILDGNFKILGTLTKDEISFDVSEVVDKNDLGMFKNYFTNNHTYFNAGLAFRSALPEEIYFENPFGEEPKQEHYTDCNEEKNAKDWIYNLEKWQTAKENITEKLLILQRL